MWTWPRAGIQVHATGLPVRESGDYYGDCLALASAQVSLLTLTNAYRTLGNGGRYTPVMLSLPPPLGGGEKFFAIDPRAAFIIGDILSDSNARAHTFGTDSIAARVSKWQRRSDDKAVMRVHLMRSPQESMIHTTFEVNHAYHHYQRPGIQP